MKPAPFRYARADSLAEAIALLAAGHGDAKVLAGGQSLVPMLNMRLARPAMLVDLNGVRELAGIVPAPGGGLRIGTMTRHAELITSPAVRDRAPLLAEAARHVGHAAIRNQGTLGGSVAHADPAAELPAALVALDARLHAAGPRGTRVIAAADFFRGLLATALAPDEILTAVDVPAQPPGWGFAEIARRPGDFALAGVATVVRAGHPLALPSPPRRGEGDELAHLGVVVRALPITPEQVWRWLGISPLPPSLVEGLGLTRFEVAFLVPRRDGSGGGLGGALPGAVSSARGRRLLASTTECRRELRVSVLPGAHPPARRRGIWSSPAGWRGRAAPRYHAAPGAARARATRREGA